MDTTALERGNTITEQLKTLTLQLKALELTDDADNRKIGLSLEGRETVNDTWKTLHGTSLASIIGQDVYLNAVNVARILLLEATKRKMEELRREFMRL
jgi:hypothetical protein